MPNVFSYKFDTAVFKGNTSFNTGLFINGRFVDGVEHSTIDIINPATGKVITKVSEATAKDVDLAVAAAQDAYETVWGLNTPGAQRAALLNKLADLMEENLDELAALEALNTGKAFTWAKVADVPGSVKMFRYFAGWADKVTGQTLETNEGTLAYTRHEPIGVVGQIIPWNFPLFMLSGKLAPALATGNAIVLKPSEMTPLTALRVCELINAAGFPPGVVNILTGYGNTVGQAMSEHMKIEKLSFTGSTITGRKVMEAASKSNLKGVALELGGKSPNIVFDDADIDQAVNWASHGIFFNQGQTCTAGSRVFVHKSVYEEFVEKFTAKALSLKIGDPFAPDTYHGPQVSKTQYERVMGYIESGKQEGAKVHLGGGKLGTDGYFIQPTIFTDTKPNMKIVREEIFGPVVVVIKFEDDDDVIRQANNTIYGLAAAVFSQNINRAIKAAHRLQAGTAWINCVNSIEPAVAFGGYKQSGIGRELGEYGLKTYTNVKSVHVNLGHLMN